MPDIRYTFQTEEQRRFAKNVVKDASRHCVYCGDWFQCKDHYVPMDWISYHRTFTAGDVVPACFECNAMLGNIAKFSIPARAEYLISAYERRAQKWLRVPPWSERELAEMGYTMRKQIKMALMLRSIYIAKLRNLDLCALGYDPVPIPLQ